MGVSELPLNLPVEIEMVVEVRTSGGRADVKLQPGCAERRQGVAGASRNSLGQDPGDKS